MYNIFAFLKINRVSPSINQSSLLDIKIDTYQPLPSKNEPIEDDKPIPKRDM